MVTAAAVQRPHRTGDSAIRARGSSVSETQQLPGDPGARTAHWSSPSPASPEDPPENPAFRARGVTSGRRPRVSHSVMILLEDVSVGVSGAILQQQNDPPLRNAGCRTRRGLRQLLRHVRRAAPGGGRTSSSQHQGASRRDQKLGDVACSLQIFVRPDSPLSVTRPARFPP